MKLSNSNPKLISFLNPSHLQKPSTTSPRWVIALITFFTFAFLVTLICTPESSPVTHHVPAAASLPVPATTVLPTAVITTLVHYVSMSNDTYRMSYRDLKMVADVLINCTAPCNLLVFGLTHETPLWKALNHYGRTVFIDESRYYVEHMERLYPGIEAYDVHYTTKVKNTPKLIAAAKKWVLNKCRPVQNLLFSDCRLGINDLPNFVYDVDWDVILVPGPRGDWPDAPGRISSIFTAGVFSRRKNKKLGEANPRTHVFLLSYYSPVDKMCGDVFLCRENLVESSDMLAHFVVERADNANVTHFCNRTTAVSKQTME